MPRNEKAIYLTFDDGPVPEITPWVLETLEKHEAKATFFCIGDNVRKHPGTYKLLLDAGHAVGNHTFNHLKGWETDDQRYLENIRKCSELVGSGMFRPPYGRIKRSQIKKLRHAAPFEEHHVPAAHGDLAETPALEQIAGEASPLAGTSPRLPREIIMWDVLSGDFDPGLSPEKCLKNVLTHAGNGSIVVFHDSLKAEKRLRFTLPRALAHWKENNFQLKKLTF